MFEANRDHFVSDERANFPANMVSSGSSKPYVLLTGATGMLGSYFLRDLLRDGYAVVVLARSSRKKGTAEQRIERIMQRWEHELRTFLPRPKVIEGGLTDTDWIEKYGAWIGDNVGTMIHSAASLQFHGHPEGEPYTTNVGGTRNLLGLCRNIHLRKFHLISTAYVAGASKEFFESDVDEGQQMRNDYEKSKLESEKMVRGFGFDELTVYRPSIVVGDTRTGYAETFSGFYAQVKLVHTLVSQVPIHSTNARRVLESIGMNGTEKKNFVPVDWIADVFRHIFSHPKLHGKTYHLTNPNPPFMLDVASTIQDAVEAYSNFVARNDPTGCSEEWFRSNFAAQMQLFDAYLNSDAHFDSSNTISAAAHLPCPIVDRKLLMFLARVAIENGFGKRTASENKSVATNRAAAGPKYYARVNGQSIVEKAVH